MNISTEDYLQSILENLDQLEYIKSDEIPNIDLYMDQLTTFMDHRLRNLARTPGEDKVMTKTMINNYAKNDLLPPSNKKKYCKEHVLLLLFIYYFKGILSINDIQTLLAPLTERYFRNGDGTGLKDIYEEVFSLEKAEIVTDMVADESRTAAKKHSGGIILYFGEKDESLWEICKRYEITLLQLKAENHLQEEKLSEKQLLLIPSA